LGFSIKNRKKKKKKKKEKRRRKRRTRRRREDVNKDEDGKNVRNKRGTILQRIGCRYFWSLNLTLCSEDIGFRGESTTKETQ
jgi:uncharacterized Fe-S cluster-containing MiaB family protein